MPQETRLFYSKPFTWFEASTLGANVKHKGDVFRKMPDFVKLGQHYGFDVIYFSQLVNWRTFSNEEFKQIAVCLPTHP